MKSGVKNIIDSTLEKVRNQLTLWGPDLILLRYDTIDTIEEFNVDSKAEYTA